MLVQHTVVVSWVGKGILMVGPFGDWLRYSFEDPIILVEEVGVHTTSTPFCFGGGKCPPWLRSA